MTLSTPIELPLGFLLVTCVGIALAAMFLGAVLAMEMHERSKKWRRLLLSADRLNAKDGVHSKFKIAEPPKRDATADQARAAIDGALGSGAAVMTDENKKWSESVARAVERGADAFQRANPSLTREQAVRRARKAIHEVGADKVAGGIPSA